jgi:hypothetical protein
LSALGAAGIQSKYMCSSLSQPYDNRNALVFVSDAERRASGAPGSGREGRADAGGRRLHAWVRLGALWRAARSGMWPAQALHTQSLPVSLDELGRPAMNWMLRIHQHFFGMHGVEIFAHGLNLAVAHLKEKVIQDVVCNSWLFVRNVRAAPRTIAWRGSVR